jgi:hypothetical protein
MEAEEISLKALPTLTISMGWIPKRLEQRGKINL